MLRSCHSPLRPLCPVGRPANVQRTWGSVSLGDAFIWRRGGQSVMLLSVGCCCFPYTEKNPLSDEKLCGIGSGGPPETLLKLHFFCDLWRSQYVDNIKPPPPKSSQHLSAHQHAAGTGTGLSIPIHTAIWEQLVTDHRSCHKRLYNTSGRAGFIPPVQVTCKSGELQERFAIAEEITRQT